MNGIPDRAGEVFVILTVRVIRDRERAFRVRLIRGGAIRARLTVRAIGEIREATVAMLGGVRRHALGDLLQGVPCGNLRLTPLVDISANASLLDCAPVQA